MKPAAPWDEDGHGKGLKLEYVAGNQCAARLQRFVPRRNLNAAQTPTAAPSLKRLFAATARSGLQAATFCRYRAYMDVRKIAMPSAVTLGRQIPAGKRTRLPDRHAGPGAPADDAAPARPRRRPQHRLLHFRLSRLAAGRLRPGAVAGQALHQEEPHRVPARRQRGPGGHGTVGHPADPPLSRRPLRRRVRHVVRQGPGRRPFGRRPEARQLCRHLAARRHRRPGRRRSYGQVVDDGPPERARLHGRRHSGDPSRQRAGVSRFRPACLRDVALLGPVGRLQGDERDRRIPRPRSMSIRIGSRSIHRPTSSCRQTACTSAGQTIGWARSAAS